MKLHWFAMAAVAVGLQACDGEVRTVVVTPRDAAPSAPVPAPAPASVPAPPAAPVPPQAAATPPSVPSAPAVAESSAPSSDDAAALLSQRHPIVPVQGVPASRLVDNYDEQRGTGRHEAIDIMAPRGTPVVAVDDGPVAKLFTSKRGGLTVYQFDAAGRLAYYYAHLDRYADGLAQGSQLQRGQVLGYVGSTGDASPDAPHLHFAVFRLGPEKQWWKGSPVNPFPALTAAHMATAER